MQPCPITSKCHVFIIFFKQFFCKSRNSGSHKKMMMGCGAQVKLQIWRCKRQSKDHLKARLCSLAVRQKSVSTWPQALPAGNPCETDEFCTFSLVAGISANSFCFCFTHTKSCNWLIQYSTECDFFFLFSVLAIQLVVNLCCI